MNENTTKLILTVAVVGLVVYFIFSTKPKPVATVARPPSSAGPGTALKNDVNMFAQLASSIGGLFSRSSSGPTVPTSTTMTVPSGFQPATLAQDTATLQSEGWTGVGGPTTSETDLGITPEDYY